MAQPPALEGPPRYAPTKGAATQTHTCRSPKLRSEFWGSSSRALLELGRPPPPPTPTERYTAVAGRATEQAALAGGLVEQADGVPCRHGPLQAGWLAGWLVVMAGGVGWGVGGRAGSKRGRKCGLRPPAAPNPWRTQRALTGGRGAVVAGAACLAERDVLRHLQHLVRGVVHGQLEAQGIHLLEVQVGGHPAGQAGHVQGGLCVCVQRGWGGVGVLKWCAERLDRGLGMARRASAGRGSQDNPSLGAKGWGSWSICQAASLRPTAWQVRGGTAPWQ